LIGPPDKIYTPLFPSVCLLPSSGAVQGGSDGLSRVLGGGLRRLGGDRGGLRGRSAEGPGRPGSMRPRGERRLLGGRLVWLPLPGLAQQRERGRGTPRGFLYRHLRGPARRRHPAPRGGGRGREGGAADPQVQGQHTGEDFPRVLGRQQFVLPSSEKGSVTEKSGA